VSPAAPMPPSDGINTDPPGHFSFDPKPKRAAQHVQTLPTLEREHRSIRPPRCKRYGSTSLREQIQATKLVRACNQVPTTRPHAYWRGSLQSASRLPTCLRTRYTCNIWSSCCGSLRRADRLARRKQHQKSRAGVAILGNARLRRDMIQLARGFCGAPGGAGCSLPRERPPWVERPSSRVPPSEMGQGDARWQRHKNCAASLSRYFGGKNGCSTYDGDYIVSGINVL
jgi:hypothetical protein